jgi:hypothetical protein
MSDLKFALRRLRQNSGLIAAVMLTIGLCFGANLLISAVINSVLLRHFPFPIPDQLVVIFNSSSNSNVAQEPQLQITTGKSKI